MAESSLEALLARVALRDQTAYEALYKASTAKLFGFALRILQRRDLAEDCLQDAFVSIWYRAGDYRPERASAFTWMAAIVRNRALDMLRSAASTHEIADGVERDLPASDAAGAEDIAASADDVRALKRCLDALAPAQRQAIAAAYFRGLAHAELARSLREPLGTVKTWTRTALGRLRSAVRMEAAQ